MNKPTAVHVAGNYYFLTENWIHTQVQHLTRYQPLVLTWRTENLDHGWAPEVYALLERPGWESLANRALRQVLGIYPSFYYMVRRAKAQVIHAHYGHRAHLTVPLSKATGVPLVTTFYGFDLSLLPRQDPVWRDRYQALFKYGACFLVEGHYMAQQLRDLGCPEQKLSIQHLGIDLNQFPVQLRQRIEREPLRLLMAARFTEKKGIVFAVQAVARLVDWGIDTRLTIIGDAGSSDESQATKRQILAAIEGLGLTHRVELRGMQPRDDLRNAYYEHHVFVQPSVQAASGNNEGGAPVTLIEASATGMPVVATYHCDIPEVVKDGITGLLAPERDAETLAEHLLSLATSPAYMSEMGAAGHKHVEAEYDARKQGQRLEKLYDRVVTGGANCQ